MEFDNINTRDFNTDRKLNSARPPLPNGWYSLQLSKASEEKESRSPGLFGQIFTFEVGVGEYKGDSFSLWMATRSRNPKFVNMVADSNAIFARIARCLGITVLRSTNQLMEQSFFAYITQKEQKRTVSDLDENDNEIKKEVTTISNQFVGNLNSIILSCEDYDKKFSRGEGTDRRKKFVKKPFVEEVPDDPGIEETESRGEW